MTILNERNLVFYIFIDKFKSICQVDYVFTIHVNIPFLCMNDKIAEKNIFLFFDNINQLW